MFKQQKGEELPWIGDVPNGERVYQPVGDTDSEKMFCSILNALKAKFDTLPSLPVLYDYLRQLLTDIVSKDEEATILNCLLGCGQHVQFAYSWPGARPGSSVWNGLYYVVREFPFQTTKLSDCDYDLDFSQVCDERDRVAVIATKPLTMNENWIEFNRGELILFDEGLPNKAPEECFKSEISGHGLMSNMIPASATLEEDMRRFCYKQDAFVSYAGADI
jgi:glutamine amidotransferase